MRVRATRKNSRKNFIRRRRKRSYKSAKRFKGPVRSGGASDTPQEDVGFIMLRCVRKKEQNTLYKECYEAIRKYHPDLKIVIIDDNSDKSVLESDYPMTNVEIIESEYPTAGEYLPYWYLLQRKIFKKAIFVQDSMILNTKIPYENVEDFMFLYETGNVTGYQEETKQLLENTIIPEKLRSIYDSGNWRGCWGSMTVITSDFLSKIEESIGISKWKDIIRSRGLRIGLESAIGICCVYLKGNDRGMSLFGKSDDMNVMKDPGNEKYTLDMYLADKTRIKDSIIKIWNGR